MILKTIKDLRINGLWSAGQVGSTDKPLDYSHQESILKKEAINWIKYLREKIKECNSIIGEDNWHRKNDCPHWIEIEDDFYSFCGCHNYYCAQIQILMEIFNITEENLK